MPPVRALLAEGVGSERGAVRGALIACVRLSGKMTSEWNADAKFDAGRQRR